MGLLDQVVGGLLNSQGGGGSPLQGVLMNMLGGGQAGGPQYGGGGAGMGGAGLGGMGGGGAAAGIGGLGGIISAFQQAGLGQIVQSWIGNGQNMPVSPDQLRGVLGNDRVQSMASQSGMGEQDFLSQLSQHLPNAVNGVTPNGQLPDEGTVSV